MSESTKGKNGNGHDEQEGSASTSIRPKARKRLKFLLAAGGAPGEQAVDFITNAVNDRVKRVAQERGIQFPEDMAFTAGE